jgi:adenine-specific DNA-methyltransferase
MWRLPLARQRSLTAKYDTFELADPQAGPSGSSIYKTVPHITFKSIAQNQALDSVFARWEPLLAEKERREGKSAVTDADRRRWLLPSPDFGRRVGDEGESGWKEWEVRYDTGPDWPAELQETLPDIRKTWRGKIYPISRSSTVIFLNTQSRCRLPTQCLVKQNPSK